MRDVGGGFFLFRFFTGARFAASGIAFTFRHRALFLWSLIPMLVQLVLFAALLTGGVVGAGKLVDHIRPEAGHWYSFVGAVMFVAAVLVVVVASVVGALLIGSVVCDPFYDKLSEVTESILVGKDMSTPLTAAGVVDGIVRELFALPLRLGVYGVGAIALWALGLTGIGSVVAVPLSLAWTWLFVALAAWSRSLARHAVPGGRRLAGLFKQPTIALGFGAVGWVLSYIPLTSPFLVVGGTRLYLALAAWDRIESSLSDDDKRALRA
jgi:CysZ protein